ncbi:MAG: hypothetical protein ACI8RD_006669 [Bacillariaceae sp.]|jgi:hypothetical protein
MTCNLKILEVAQESDKECPRFDSTDFKFSVFFDRKVQKLINGPLQVRANHT